MPDSKCTTPAKPKKIGMVISEVIKELGALKEKHGDLPVYCNPNHMHDSDYHPVIEKVGGAIYFEAE